MTTFKELIISFFEVSRERLKNPAIGTFALSWTAINWRFVSILFFSELKIEERIKLIEESYINLSFNLWYPLIVTGIYLLILPNLMALVDVLSRWAISFRKQISNNHKLEDILAKQEIAVEERQLELVEEGSPDIPKLKEQIEKLTSENKSLKDKLESNDKIVDQVEPTPMITSSPPAEEPNTSPPKRKKSTAKKANTNNQDKTENKVVFASSKDYPAMRENVIRNVAKSEKEWILLYGFYAGNFGEKEFTREDIMGAYEETKRKMDSRTKNLSNNMKNLVKQGLIRFLNNDEMLLTEQGKELVTSILTR